MDTAPLHISPPLLNSASLWATTYEDLTSLYQSPHTGAISTRTSLLGGFDHDQKKHQVCFFDAHGGTVLSHEGDSSLNTLGYSPINLQGYISIAQRIFKEHAPSAPPIKPIILSVTGSEDDITSCYARIAHASFEHEPGKPNLPLAMELNLSCPNLADKPPPAYHPASLESYLRALDNAKKAAIQTYGPAKGVPPIGIKLPPYTHSGQYEQLFSAIPKRTNALDFITATNTLGSSLVLQPPPSASAAPALNSESGTGIGGLAGAALHPLALGNVKTLRMMLDRRPDLRGVKLIGVGGVGDGMGYERMRAVGADAVGVATALGREGVGVFEKIAGAEPC